MRNFGKALGCLGVILVPVRVQFFGELALLMAFWSALFETPNMEYGSAILVPVFKLSVLDWHYSPASQLGAMLFSTLFPANVRSAR